MRQSGLFYKYFYCSITYMICIGNAHTKVGYGNIFIYSVFNTLVHLLALCKDAHVEVFPKMNHGQLLIDHPETVAERILGMVR